MKRESKFVLTFLALLFLIFAPLVSADTDTDLQKAALEKELAKVEAQIAVQNKLIEVKQREAATLARDRQLLNSQIEQAKLVIRQHEIKISQLVGDISTKQKTITDLSYRISQSQETLSELLRRWRNLEQFSLVEVMLDGNNLSEFFRGAEQYQYVGDSIQKLSTGMRQDKTESEEVKAGLEKRRAAELNAKKVIEGERTKIERMEKEKANLLKITNNEADDYREVLAERKKRADDIRGALFRLRGVQAITFGEALDHANFIAKRTGVRAAFLLAIITQESNLGANVGTCNRPGDPPEKNWSEIMKPTRDKEPFLKIVKALGISPEGLPLSCPMAGGWGGAMGPAQFIPSTWVNYEAKITAITGNNPPNPWTPRDAFTASGVFLKELGADAGTWTAERTAALKYYAGGNWNLPKNAFYGDEVMGIARQYQTSIDTLQDL